MRSPSRRTAQSVLGCLLAVALGISPCGAQPARAAEREVSARGSAPAAADAQPQGPPAPPPGVEEIVIFGSPSTSILPQEQSASVLSFDMEDLEAQGTIDIRGLAAYTPNLEVKTAFAASNPVLFIRGVGLKDYFANASSAVAVWNDDIYMNSPTGQLFQLFDVESVDVLRGPQTLLYGRNATAGAILVRARKPTGAAEADLSVEYGNFDLVTAQGALELPLWSDTLATRLSFQLIRQDGWMRNRCGTAVEEPEQHRFCPPPQDRSNLDAWVNDQGRWAARNLLRWQPRDDLELLLNVHGGQNRSGSLNFQKLGVRNANPLTETRSGTDAATYSDGDLPFSFAGLQRLPATNSPLDGDPFAGDFTQDCTPLAPRRPGSSSSAATSPCNGDEDLDLFGVDLKVIFTLGDFELTSITGWAQNDRLSFADVDAMPQQLLETIFDNQAQQLTQDLRVRYDPGGSWWLEGGGWFLTEQLEIDNLYVGGINLPIRNQQQIDQETLAFAGFLSVSRSIGENLRLEAGARYNWDRKRFDLAADLLFLGTAQNPIPIRRPVGRANEEGLWQSPTGEVVLHYEARDGLDFYLKYAHAFKAGQFNGQAITQQAILTEASSPVDAESVDNFELGAKSLWWEDRLSANGALFYTRYNDQQVFQLENAAGSFPTPRLLNASDAVIYGIELDLQVQPTEWLDLATSFGMLESEYVDFTHEFDKTEGQNIVHVTTDYSGNRLLNSPHFAWSGHAQLDIPLGRYGALVPRFDWAFKSDIAFDPNEGRGALGEFPKGTLGQANLWLLNARLAWHSPDESIELAGWVRNLTDEAYVIDAFDISTTQFQSLIFVIGQPRFYGLSVSLQY